MRKVVLTRDRYALVDDQDFELVNKWKWNCSSRGYAVRMDWSKGKHSPTSIYMHRLLIKAPVDLVVDHINGNKLDNRTNNLRVCSQRQNCANSSIPKNNKSGYKGVSWYKAYKKWAASIMVDRKSLFLGYFDDVIDAANAYNRAAIENFGEFAKLNEVRT